MSASSILHINVPQRIDLGELSSKVLPRLKPGQKFAVFQNPDLVTPKAGTIKQMNPNAYDGQLLWGAKSHDGRLGKETFYKKGIEELNNVYIKKHKGMIQKALDSSGASVFLPTVVAPGVVDVIKRRNPFYAMVPKKVMTSKTMTIPVRTSSLVDSINYSAESASALTALDQTYTSVTATARLLFVAGTVTHFAQATAESTLDLYAQEVNDHFTDMISFKEKAMFRAEQTAGGTWASHFTSANGFDGIVKRIESAASSNLITLSSQSISIAHIDTMCENIFANNGEVSVIFCDPSTFTKLKSQARDFKRIGANDTGFGFPDRSITIDEIPVIASNNLVRTSGERAAIALDINAVEFRTLVPDTYVEVSQDASPTKKFFFETFEDFVVTAPQWCSAVINGA